MSTQELFRRVKAKPKLVQILKQLKGPSTTKEIADRLKWDWYWVTFSLKELSSAGLVKLIGETLYQLTDVGQKVLERIEAMERVVELKEAGS